MGKLREEINGLKKNYWVYWKCSQEKVLKVEQNVCKLQKNFLKV